MIARMAKVQILGPRRLLPDVLRFLQEQGILQLRSLPAALAESGPGAPPLLSPVPVAVIDVAAEDRLESLVARIDALLAALPGTRGVAGPAAAPPDPTSPELAARLDAVAGELRRLEERRAELLEEREVVARYGKLLVALAPLRPPLPPGAGARAIGLVVRRDHPEALSLLEREVARITGGAYDLQWREVDREQLAVLLTVASRRAHEVSALLFERGVEEVRLPDRYAGQPLVRALSLLAEREREIPREMRRIEAALGDLARRERGLLWTARTAARNRLERLRAVRRCGETEHAFVVMGYLPASRLRALQEAAATAFDGRVVVLELPIRREEHGEVPVVLDNPRWLRPFELLLSLVALPRYGSVDPTPYLAVFFPLFFGLMLGDMGFGLIAAALALVARHRRWGGEMGRKVSAVALACASSAIVFGVLFGEAFGELGARFGLHPLVIDRRRSFIAFLAVALAFGVIHVLLGMALGVADAARNGRRREALARAARLALVVAAGPAIAGMAGVLPLAAARVAVAALGALAVVAVSFGGPMVLLEWVLSLGNILSYARLMALGLASVMLAEVANRVAATLEPVGLGLVIALVLHGANFTLGLISPTIGALRLHYVEFFEKFYEEGGSPYAPFAPGL